MLVIDHEFVRFKEMNCVAIPREISLNETQVVPVRSLVTRQINREREVQSR